MNLYHSITIIKNSLKKNHTKTKIRNTRLNRCLLDILWDEGYIRGYSFSENQQIIVLLKYSLSGKSLQKIQTISKPSCRVYLKSKELWQVQKQSLSTLILFTSKGIITGQKACYINLGGEVLCSVSLH